MLEHHPDGPLTQLLRIPALSRHGPNLSRVGASKKPGAIQTCLRAISDTNPRSSEPKYGGSPAAAFSAARPRFEVAGITT